MSTVPNNNEVFIKYTRFMFLNHMLTINASFFKYLLLAYFLNQIVTSGATCMIFVLYVYFVCLKQLAFKNLWNFDLSLL